MKNEFILSAENHCLFHCDGTNGSQRFPLVWVDDICTFQTTTKCCMISKRNSAMAFSIDDRGKMTWLLGCNVEQSRGRISLSKRSYMKDIMRKSHMFDCKPVSTPPISHTNQSESDCPVKAVKIHLSFANRNNIVA